MKYFSSKTNGTTKLLRKPKSWSLAKDTYNEDQRRGNKQCRDDDSDAMTTASSLARYIHNHNDYGDDNENNGLVDLELKDFPTAEEYQSDDSSESSNSDSRNYYRSCDGYGVSSSRFSKEKGTGALVSRYQLKGGLISAESYGSSNVKSRTIPVDQYRCDGSQIACEWTKMNSRSDTNVQGTKEEGATVDDEGRTVRGKVEREESREKVQNEVMLGKEYAVNEDCAKSSSRERSSFDTVLGLVESPLSPSSFSPKTDNCSSNKSNASTCCSSNVSSISTNSYTCSSNSSGSASDSSNDSSSSNSGSNGTNNKPKSSMPQRSDHQNQQSDASQNSTNYWDPLSLIPTTVSTFFGIGITEESKDENPVKENGKVERTRQTSEEDEDSGDKNEKNKELNDDNTSSISSASSFSVVILGDTKMDCNPSERKEAKKADDNSDYNDALIDDLKNVGGEVTQFEELSAITGEKTENNDDGGSLKMRKDKLRNFKKRISSFRKLKKKIRSLKRI